MNDAISKLTEWSSTKHAYGQGTGIVAPRERYLLLKKLDNPLRNLFNRFNQQIRKISKDVDVYQAGALEDIGHPLSIKIGDKYSDLLKGSNINNLQTLVFQDPVVNQKILIGEGFENQYYDIFDRLKMFKNKKITKENRLDLLNIKKEMEDNYNNIIKSIVDKQKDNSYFIGQEKRIPKITLNVPKVGETLKGSDIFADMSTVDSEFIVGKVSNYNSEAKKYNQLSNKEKTLYKENLKDQFSDSLEKYYTAFGYTADEITDLLESFETGTDQFMRLPKSEGGGVEITPLSRSNFGNGGAAGADVDFATELEYFFTNPDAELPVMQTYKETNNPVEVLNDIINPRNYPYYADVLARSGIRIGEFGARLLPATGKLISDLIQKPAFKIKSTEDNYVRDYLDPPAPSNIKGTGIFSEFLENITPTTLEKKVGLDTLIKKEEQRLKDTGSTVGPKVFADTLGLGTEVAAPIFPGLKLLRAYAKKNNLPVNDVTQKLLVKEIDEVLEQRGMNRREFLQATGAGATVILAKLLGFGDEMARTAKVAEKVAEKTTGGGVPPYFFQLVEKIRRSGKQLEPEFDARVENNMQFENFVMKENMATGEISIQRTTEGGFNTGDDVIEGTISDELITYKPGENVLGKDGKYYRTADEYEEVTAKPDNEGKMKDIEPGLDSIEEIIELLPNKLKMSELEAAGYNVDAFSDKIKQLLIDDLPDLP